MRRFFVYSAEKEGLLASARDPMEGWCFRIIKVNFMKNLSACGAQFFFMPYPRSSKLGSVQA